MRVVVRGDYVSDCFGELGEVTQRSNQTQSTDGNQASVGLDGGGSNGAQVDVAEMR